MPQGLPSVVVFAPDEPINDDDEDNYTIDGRDVVHICSSPNPRLNLLNRMKEGKHLLLAITGTTGGNEYMMSVNSVHMSRTMFEKRPIGPSQKGPWRMLFRPRMRRQTMGIAGRTNLYLFLPSFTCKGLEQPDESRKW
ncbi:MAG: hypothetical protein M1830_000634 [Pleopsidium flavum]|nr:MAG: hypothetical protein M1830_000634 [Pleopsidium flavum]